MNRILNRGADYPFYRGIPPLAGIISMQEAIDPGLSVNECVARLKRYHYALRRLHEIFIAHITAEPIYELKMAFSLHLHYCAEHVTALRQRIGEMREPPLGLDVVPDQNLEIFFDEIRNAPTTGERITAIFGKAVPALIEAMQRHMDDTNKIVDHPSFRLCRFALIELKEMADFGQKAIAGLVDEMAREKMRPWLDLLDDCLVRAGGLDGSLPASAIPVARLFSAKPFEHSRIPTRDERFVDPYNTSVNDIAFLHDKSFPPEPKVLMMFFKRLRETCLPEIMSCFIFETKNKPWDYYRDMTRQLWDEARHAMMGEIGFVSLGLDWRKIPISINLGYMMNTRLTPLERHAVLYAIEKGLMSKTTGKRFEWELCIASQNPMATLFQDYDWADEVLHTQIGRKWYVKEIGDSIKAVEYADQCFSSLRAMKWCGEGLTENRNWWPELYTEACRNAGMTPDPRVLAYGSSSEAVSAESGRAIAGE